MPERERYSHLFKGNPFARIPPNEMFSVLNWGNTHRNTFTIDAPEPMVMLGMAKFLVLADREITFSAGRAFLVVGQRSNELYIIPRLNDAPLPVVPSFSRKTCRLVGPVHQTDYLSAKGGKTLNHYYHEHQKPYPNLWLHRSGVGYIRAANNNGQPSYAVGKEGIVG